MINDIKENNFISKLTDSYLKSPSQLNSHQESDSELIDFSNGSNEILAITTDSIAEEIESGLYEDPYLIGWMTVIVNFSDIAAVGANPIGIMISEILPKDLSKFYLDKLHKGINDACQACNSFVLGGDTNFGEKLIMSGTAIGKVDKENTLKRTGCEPGDILYTSGPLGRGNAYAIKLFKELLIKNPSITGALPDYKPSPRLKEGAIIRKFASSCIDSSDGAIGAIDQIMRLNNAGAVLENGWENSIDNESRKLLESLDLPISLLLAGHHGEFELIFTIPEKVNNDFLDSSEESGFFPIRLGKITMDHRMTMKYGDSQRDIDSERIRNLFFDGLENKEGLLTELVSAMN